MTLSIAKVQTRIESNGRRVLELKNRPKTERTPVKKNDKFRGRTEHATKVIRHFQTFRHRTTSVFGIRRSSLNELRIVCKVIQTMGFHALGSCEGAPEGPHCHIVAFKSKGSTPSSLSTSEEKKVKDMASSWIQAWRAQKSILHPSAWMRLKMLKLEEAKEDIVYRVMKATTAKGKGVVSGMSHFAVGYILKGCTSEVHKKSLVGTVGMNKIMDWINSYEDVSYRELDIWEGQYFSFDLQVMCLVALEVDKQLQNQIPPECVDVYTRYGKVISLSGRGKLKLFNNQYLKLGLELLRRELLKFSASSGLKTAVNRICQLYCPELKSSRSEDLSSTARKMKQSFKDLSESKRPRE